MRVGLTLFGLIIYPPSTKVLQGPVTGIAPPTKLQFLWHEYAYAQISLIWFLPPDLNSLLASESHVHAYSGLEIWLTAFLFCGASPSWLLATYYILFIWPLAWTPHRRHTHLWPAFGGFFFFFFLGFWVFFLIFCCFFFFFCFFLFFVFFGYVCSM